jgi:hypothetical protein
MAKPDIVLVDGHAFSWQRLRELRRQQLGAIQAAQPRQLALFELKDNAVLRPSGLQPAAMLSRPFLPLRLRAENARDNRCMISTLVAAP